MRAARKFLDNVLRLVDQAEKRGLTLRKERAQLSPKDVARLRRNAKISFKNWAQTCSRSGGICFTRRAQDGICFTCSRSGGIC